MTVSEAAKVVVSLEGENPEQIAARHDFLMAYADDMASEKGAEWLRTMCTRSHGLGMQWLPGNREDPNRWDWNSMRAPCNRYYRSKLPKEVYRALKKHAKAQPTCSAIDVLYRGAGKNITKRLFVGMRYLAYFSLELAWLHLLEALNSFPGKERKKRTKKLEQGKE